MGSFAKALAFSFLFVFLLGCGRSAPAPVPPPLGLEEANAVGRMSRDAALVALVRVLKVEPWKERKDWSIVTVEPEKIWKGKAPKTLSLLDVKLFPGEKDRFMGGESALVFLKELPAYTAWKEVIASGTRYSLLGRSKGLIEEGRDEVGRFAQDFQKLKPDSDAMREFLLKTLEASGGPRLREDLSREIFERDLFPFELRNEDLSRLAGLVKKEGVPDLAKKELVQGIAARPGDFSSGLLRDFFCLSPSAVCLRAAETLESRGQSLSLEEYSQAYEKGDPELRAALLEILGRHRRIEALPLFEKYLREDKDEKRAATVVEALGNLADPKAVDLALSYADDPRYYVRAAVISALGKLKSEKGIPVLEKALKTNDPSLVALAAQALQRIGTSKALQTLSRYYEKGHHGHWEPSHGPQHFNPEPPPKVPPPPAP